MMSDESIESSGRTHDGTVAVEAIERTMARLYDLADVKHVFGRPIRQGETLLIPAAEIAAAAGSGFGYAVGNGPERSVSEGESNGGGGGGGG